MWFVQKHVQGCELLAIPEFLPLSSKGNVDITVMNKLDSISLESFSTITKFHRLARELT